MLRRECCGCCESLMLRAVQELQRWEADTPIREFLEEQRSVGGTMDRLPLPALLIQPVQRLCRYPMLFAEVLKVTNTRR